MIDSWLGFDPGMSTPLVGWFAANVYDCVNVDSVGDGNCAGGTARITARVDAILTEGRRKQLTGGGGGGGGGAGGGGVGGSGVGGGGIIGGSSGIGTVHPLLVFPEGTTTNGHYLIHFRSGEPLFRPAAARAQHASPSNSVASRGL